VSGVASKQVRTQTHALDQGSCLGRRRAGTEKKERDFSTDLAMKLGARGGIGRDEGTTGELVRAGTGTSAVPDREGRLRLNMLVILAYGARAVGMGKITRVYPRRHERFISARADLSPDSQTVALLNANATGGLEGHLNAFPIRTTPEGRYQTYCNYRSDRRFHTGRLYHVWVAWERERP